MLILSLTNENYFSQKANKAYMSVSQYKSFTDCEACAMAELNGEYKKPMTTAMLVGSYVDAYYEGTLEIFKAQHPEIFKRDGNLRADYIKADEIIKRTESDAVFQKFMSGEKQKIFTAELFGCNWKIKIDSLLTDKIVDLKCMANLKWGYDSRLNRWNNFVSLWRYDLQLAVYQEIYFRAAGKRLPVYIAACTKEDVPDIEIIDIPQWRLNECLYELERTLPHILDVKNGKVLPQRCGVCNYCKSTKVIKDPVSFDLAGLSSKERKEWE